MSVFHYEVEDKIVKCQQVVGMQLWTAAIKGGVDCWKCFDLILDLMKGNWLDDEDQKYSDLWHWSCKHTVSNVLLAEKSQWWHTLVSISSLQADQRWEVTKYKYFVTDSDFSGICTLLEYLFSDHFLLLLPTFEHKYLNFLLFTFLKQLLTSVLMLLSF